VSAAISSGEQSPRRLGFARSTVANFYLPAVREAEHDIEHGRVITNEQMKARIDEWTRK
jgi:predicted transcriptional regulator